MILKNKPVIDPLSLSIDLLEFNLRKVEYVDSIGEGKGGGNGGKTLLNSSIHCEI